MSEVGKLREFVTVEVPTETPDNYGGFTVTWATLAQAWAKVSDQSANHAYHAESLEHRISHKITVREKDVVGINIKCRIIWETRTFHIHGISDPSERDRFLELRCEEGDGAAS